MLHAHVSRQPLEPCWISKSSVKGRDHMGCSVSCCGYPRTVLSLEQGLIILLLDEMPLRRTILQLCIFPRRTFCCSLYTVCTHIFICYRTVVSKS